jgi:hypothetical protein
MKKPESDRQKPLGMDSQLLVASRASHFAAQIRGISCNAPPTGDTEGG